MALRLRSWVIGSFCLVLLLLRGAAARADRFEIQVYGAETAPRAEVGLETHVIVIASGTQSQSLDGELPTHHVTHLTFEPHLGLARWCEAGLYVQTAIRPSGSMDFAGVKLRFKARIPRRLARELIGLALNAEFSSVPATYEANQWGTEFRPIIDLSWKRLYFSVNPIVAIDLAGALAGQPQFQPAEKLSVSIVSWLSAGAEYYAAIGPIHSPFPRHGQDHQLFGVLDLVHKFLGKVEVELNVGVGYNFTGPDAWVFKTTLGVGQ